jgi:membrane associated rhomboid family serine protease
VIPIKDNIPTNRFAFVTFGLILANFVVYILATAHGGSFISGPDAHETFRYGAIPYAILHPGVHLLNANHIAAGNLLPSWETIFTGMFMHASIIHIAVNMIFLWIFGKSVEAAMGPIKYLAFYIAGGVAALALEIAVGPHSIAPTLGASGAIAAVIGAYIVLYPRARVLTFVLMIFLVTVIELPVWVLLVLWFAVQAVFGATGLTSPGSTGDAAYFAQIGGFLLGLLTARLIVSKSRRIPVPPRHPVNA